MAYIEMRDSTKRYHMGSTTITANDNVSFTIDRGNSPSFSVHPAPENRRCSTFWAVWTPTLRGR